METSTEQSQDQDYCNDLVRRLDPDRYFATLFAAERDRGDLLALYALNLELAQIRENVSEPMLGEMRFQWWHDVLVEGSRGAEVGHPVATRLLSLVARGRLQTDDLAELIEGRRKDLDNEAVAETAAAIDYAEHTGGHLGRMAIRLLGGDGAALETAFEAATAWALLELIRAEPFHANRGKAVLPRGAEGGADRAAVEALVKSAEKRLGAARAVRGDLPRQVLPAVLHCCLADGRIKRLKRAGYDPYKSVPREPGAGRLLRLYWNGRLGRF
jgi:phytoene synthase